MIVKRCTIEQDIEAVEKGIEEAEEEQKKLFELTDRMVSEPKEVALAVAQYFNQIKKDEAEIRTGIKNVEKFKKEKVRASELPSDELKKRILG